LPISSISLFSITFEMGGGMVMAENDQTNKELGGLNSKSPWKTPVAATDGDVPSPSPVMMGAPPESWPALTDAAASKPLVAPQPSPPFLQVSPFLSSSSFLFYF
jgi:hypothetical protein